VVNSAIKGLETTVSKILTVSQHFMREQKVKHLFKKKFFFPFLIRKIQGYLLVAKKKKKKKSTRIFEAF
jgi:uncharacterized membrane protein